MKKLWLIILFLTPSLASAEYMDVIELKLTDQCSFSEYMVIVNDFNTQWADAHGYHARVAMPLQSHNLESMYWMGTAKNAAAFGAAWDTWRDAQSDPDSVPAKLMARLRNCSENLSRSGYDIY
ncbi:MAG: hypothetical protein WBS20_11125 [Lysobacterales bacterium]